MRSSERIGLRGDGAAGRKVALEWANLDGDGEGAMSFGGKIDGSELSTGTKTGNNLR